MIACARILMLINILLLGCKLSESNYNKSAEQTKEFYNQVFNSCINEKLLLKYDSTTVFGCSDILLYKIVNDTIGLSILINETLNESCQEFILKENKNLKAKMFYFPKSKFPTGMNYLPICSDLKCENCTPIIYDAVNGTVNAAIKKREDGLSYCNLVAFNLKFNKFSSLFGDSILFYNIVVGWKPG
ncbi:MAG TPA: hypothetical protein PLQ57_14865 [Saprospiraceae bacterium]|nr:hypothetical protein [Saprospiraceae bacterium]